MSSETGSIVRGAHEYETVGLTSYVPRVSVTRQRVSGGCSQRCVVVLQSSIVQGSLSTHCALSVQVTAAASFVEASGSPVSLVAPHRVAANAKATTAHKPEGHFEEAITRDGNTTRTALSSARIRATSSRLRVLVVRGLVT
jgi:hypothetical protein